MKSLSTAGIGITLFLVTLVTEGAPGEQVAFERFLKRQDRDGNGVVGRTEFKGSQQFFNRVDTDQDGSISGAEFEVARKNLRAGRTGKSAAVGPDGQPPLCPPHPPWCLGPLQLSPCPPGSVESPPPLPHSPAQGDPFYSSAILSWYN